MAHSLILTNKNEKITGRIQHFSIRLHVPLFSVQLPPLTELGLHVTTGGPFVESAVYPEEQEHVELAFTVVFSEPLA